MCSRAHNILVGEGGKELLLSQPRDEKTMRMKEVHLREQSSIAYRCAVQSTACLRGSWNRESPGDGGNVTRHPGKLSPLTITQITMLHTQPLWFAHDEGSG